MDTSLVLLDEPLASLDVHLRAAMALADRIAVMDAGRLVQVARPEMLNRESATVGVDNVV